MGAFRADWIDVSILSLPRGVEGAGLHAAHALCSEAFFSYARGSQNVVIFERQLAIFCDCPQALELSGFGKTVTFADQRVGPPSP